MISTLLIVLAVVAAGILGANIAFFISTHENPHLCDNYNPTNSTDHEDFCELFLESN